MGVFRFESKYSAPTPEQRDRYMRGEAEEHHFGPDGGITLILYDNAAYLKDDIDGVRILYTGAGEKEKAVEEVRRMVEYHRHRDEDQESFRSGKDLR
jgi:hypothetical protein